MIGLSVWIEENVFLPSENYTLVRNIMSHNALFFDKYYIITNKEDISYKDNIVSISLEQLKPILKKYLGIDFIPRDHQISDIGTLLSREIVQEVSGKFENVLYVDADFLITNPLIVNELERKRKHFCLFSDCNYYCTHNDKLDDTYINAAISYTPATPDTSEYSNIRASLISEMSRRFKEHDDNEYNSVGPHLLNSVKDKLYVCRNIKPVDLPYGDIYPTGSNTVADIVITPGKYALGVHFLLSMARINKVKVHGFHVYPLELVVKVSC